MVEEWPVIEDTDSNYVFSNLTYMYYYYGLRSINLFIGICERDKYLVVTASS